MNLYPFALYPSEYSTGRVLSPRLAEAIWTRLRKEDPELTDRFWYAVGVEVCAEGLELSIYRMLCSVSGGLGRVEFTLPVKRSDLTPNEQSLLLAAEQHEALEIAEQEIERITREEHERRRQALAAELFPNLFATKEMKPSFKKYRVALFKDGTEGYTSTADNQETGNDYEGMHHFVRWLTDWVEYEELTT